MPKINPNLGHNDQSFDNRNSRSNKILKIQNSHNLKNSQSLNPMISSSINSYNPNYSKSPLTNVQILRNKGFQPKYSLLGHNYRNVHEDYIIPKSDQFQTQSSKCNCDWKKLLCILLGLLALAALTVGLFFLIRALAHRKKSTDENISAQIQNGYSLSDQSDQNMLSSNGYVNPIWFDPFTGFKDDSSSSNQQFPTTFVSPYPSTSNNIPQQPSSNPRIESIYNPGLQSYGNFGNEGYVQPIDVSP